MTDEKRTDPGQRSVHPSHPSHPGNPANPSNPGNPETPAGPPSAGRRRTAWAVATAAVALGFTAVVPSAAVEENEGLAEASETTEVVRTTLVDTEQVEGVLQHEPARTLTASGEAGTLTWLPEEGETIGRGEPVYRADEHPRVLMYGKTPFYREMGEGSRGRDVAVLEANLTELGYAGFTEDDHYTWATARAVRRWQRDAGMVETGRVGPGQVAVAEGEVRVGSVAAELGGDADGDVLELTSTRRAVGVDLELRHVHGVEEGGRAEIELPGGEVLAAEVDGVGTSVEGADAGPPGEATLPATVRPVEQRDLGDHDIALVTVRVEVGRTEDVLAVPAEVLVELPGGGRGVQTVGDGGTAQYVAVETGDSADGLVEVSAEGLAEGQAVRVPA